MFQIMAVLGYTSLRDISRILPQKCASKKVDFDNSIP